MRIRIRIYHFLVNRIPAIQKEYHRLRLEKTGVTGRIYAWLMLLWMNLCWIVGSRQLERQIYEPDRNKQAKLGKAESELVKRETPIELAEKLAFMDFERIRKDAEHRAREKAYRKSGSYEVTLREIYEELEKWTGIEAETGMDLGIQKDIPWRIIRENREQ